MESRESEHLIEENIRETDEVLIFNFIVFIVFKIISITNTLLLCAVCNKIKYVQSNWVCVGYQY